MNLLDFLFPKYCVNCKKFGDYLCPDCFSRLSFDTKNICLACGHPSYNGLTHPGCRRKYAVDGSFTCIVFNSISKKLIYQFKYKPHLTNLSSFLGDLLYESLIQNEEFNKIFTQTQKSLIVTPIPLSKTKFRKRGYNQAELLAKEMSKRFNLPVVGCLRRIKETRSQVGLSKKERKENIKGAFEIAKSSAISQEEITNHLSLIMNRNVLLVDDVLTTGSTFSEAAGVLKHNGVRRVWAVALAKED